MRSASAPTFVRLGLPLLLAAAAGCSSDKDRVEKQLSKLRDEVQHLQSETDRMGERLDAMEGRQAAVPHYAEERVAQSPTTVTRPKLKIVHVEPGVESPAEAPEDPASAPAADADTGPRLLIQGEGKSLESRMMPGPAAPVAAKTAKPDAKAAKSESGKASKDASRASKSDDAKAKKPDADAAK
jgi:hypothetical protein